MLNKKGLVGFKPYYNWNTFNTFLKGNIELANKFSFKPYYNWNTFNTRKYRLY